MSEFTTPIEMLKAQSFQRGSDRAMRFYENGSWQQLTWKEYFERVRSLALSLLKLGIQPGDRLAIYANTRLEWAIFDQACLSLQVVVIPIYPTASLEEMEIILNASQPKIVVVEAGLPARQLRLIQQRLEFIEQVVTLDDSIERAASTDKWLYWESLKPAENLEAKWNEISKAIEPAQDATIVFTSGTSGVPKGVEISFRQLHSEVTEAFKAVGVSPEDVSLSILPYSHILGRVETWGHVYTGFTLCFGRSIEKVREDLKEIKPTVMVAVPRVFEKIHSLISAQMKNNTLQSVIADWALQVGFQVSHHAIHREPLSPILFGESLIADTLVLGKVKDAFGGRLKFAICGGAPLDPHVARFFHACGILLLEGYGLTETTGAICVNTPADYEFGTVGKPLPDVELKFSELGEISVRSDKVAKGYLNDPEGNARAFQDGWFQTGDVGELTPDGRLRITDRLKDLIKTAGGKYVAPQKIEGILQNSGLISNALIHGDKKKYIVALITLEKNETLKLAKEMGLKFQDFASLTQHPEILKKVRAIVADCNSKLANHETIKKFSVLKEDFSLEAGELTPSLKLKRKLVDEKYKVQINALY